jgi:hypothetical protein
MVCSMSCCIILVKNGICSVTMVSECVLLVSVNFWSKRMGPVIGMMTVTANDRNYDLK